MIGQAKKRRKEVKRKVYDKLETNRPWKQELKQMFNRIPKIEMGYDKGKIIGWSRYQWMGHMTDDIMQWERDLNKVSSLLKRLQCKVYARSTCGHDLHS
jgi:hypothetical protein